MPRRLIARCIPLARRCLEHRALSWLGPALHQPRLWHMSRRGIAAGAAIGGFFGLLIPVGQMPAAALVAVALRANLPTAVASTFVTNPFTFAPLYWLAYQLGSFLGFDAQPIVAATTGWFDKVVSIGKPLFVGLGLMAVAYALLSYALVSVSWSWLIHRRRRRRLRSAQRVTVR